MVKDGLLFVVGCLCALAPWGQTGRAEGLDTPSGIEKLLAVNTALRQGREYLQRGEYEAAVNVLESRLAWIDANPVYLSTLREAYLGYIRQLQRDGKEPTVQQYLRRLRAVDPGAVLELNQPTGQPTQSKPDPEPSAPTKPSQRPGRVVRGDITDPFADANSRDYQEAQVLLARAEREFTEKQYADAARFYDLAARASPKLVEDSKDRWAYCKMHIVVEKLNKGDSIDAPKLVSEVRRAMEMSPTKLNDFGNTLLRKIEARENGGAVEPTVPANNTADVRHGEKQGGWEVAESQHFRIFHNQPRETAEHAARVAEATRVKMAQRWFGDNGQEWETLCDIYLHRDADAYSKATGQPPSCPGHSTMQNEGERVLSRRIDLHCDNEHMLAAVLPHETTHVVLSGRFGEKPLPRWADEGMAVLTEPRERIDLHLRNMAQYRKEGRLFKMNSLLPMTEYPQAKFVSSFYAESVSVVEFLTKRKGHRAFAKFLHDGMYRGYESALEQHYGIRGYEELEQMWLREVDERNSLTSNGP